MISKGNEFSDLSLLGGNALDVCDEDFGAAFLTGTFKESIVV